VGSARATGDYSGGVHVQAANSDVIVTVGEAYSAGDRSNAIVARGRSATIHTTGQNVSTASDGFAIAANAADEAVVFADGPISNSGATSNGIGAQGETVYVSAPGTITSTGFMSNNVNLRASGDITARLGTLISYAGVEPPNSN